MTFIKNSKTAYIVLAFVLVGVIAVVVGSIGDAGGERDSQAALALAADLSSSEDFSVLAALSASAAGTGTTISGNLGLSPGLAVSRTGPWTVGGSEYFGTGGPSEDAQADALDAFTDLAGQPSDGTWSLNPSPAPGVWTAASSATFPGPTLTLTGDYDDVWVFQVGASLTFTGSVVMAGNAQPCNVFWQVGSDATIASGSHFVGTLIASGDVTLVSGATVDGRIISLNSSITTDGNVISGPACDTAPPPPPPTTGTLHIIKHVVVDDGGSATASESILAVSGTNVSSASFAGSEAGVDVTLDAGAYEVTEPIVPTGYSQSASEDCAGTIGAGETRTCTVTNDDIAPRLTVNKVVVNDDGGSKVISDFPLFIDGSSVISGAENAVSAGLHTVSETSDAGYAPSSWGGDCAADGTITLALGDIKTCTITNDDIAVALSPSPSSGGGGGGSSRSSGSPIIQNALNPLALPMAAVPGFLIPDFLRAMIHAPDKKRRASAFAVLALVALVAWYAISAQARARAQSSTMQDAHQKIQKSYDGDIIADAARSEDSDGSCLRPRTASSS